MRTAASLEEWSYASPPLLGCCTILVGEAGHAQEKSRRGYPRPDIPPTACACGSGLGACRALALGHDALRGFHRDGRVAAIGVGADRVGESLVQRRAADQHDMVAANALFDQRIDHD